jgi:hypothetical protein
MDVCAEKCSLPSESPLPIIAHDCPNFALLQKWAMGLSARIGKGCGRLFKQTH